MSKVKSQEFATLLRLIDWSNKESVCNSAPDREATVAALKTVLHLARLEKNSLRSLVHPLGFTRVFLHERDANGCVVLNIFPGKEFGKNSDQHDHCYNFFSEVILGGLRNESYDFNEGATSVIHEMLEYGGGSNLIAVSIQPQHVKLAQAEAVIVNEGENYFVAGSEIHRSVSVKKLTATVQYQGPYIKNSAKVYRDISNVTPEVSSISSEGLINQVETLLSYKGETMSDFGEKRFLKCLLDGLSPDLRFVNGFGHDASVLDLGLSDINLVMKIDRAASPIAAVNGWSNYKSWGRMAVTANCSDILATGAKPEAFMLAMCLPPEFLASDASDIVRGCVEECEKRGLTFLGGDTKESREAIVVGSAIGTTKKGLNFSRLAGEHGDKVFIGGYLGGFLAGYWLMKSNLAGKHRKAALKVLSHPTAQWETAELVRNFNRVRGGMDLSDGLAEAAVQMVTNGCGMVLYEEKLPLHPLVALSTSITGIPSVNHAFGVGDWTIMYVVAPDSVKELERLAIDQDVLLSCVGEVVDYEGVHLKTKNDIRQIHVPPNEHFRSRMEDQDSFMDAIRDLKL